MPDAPRHQIAFGGMEIAARGIAALRPRGFAVGFPGRQPERHLEQSRDRIEVERMRRWHPAAAQRAVAGVEMVRKQRQLDSRGAFITAERIRLIGPVKAPGPRRVSVQVVLATLVVVRERVGSHGQDYMAERCIPASADSTDTPNEREYYSGWRQ